MSSAIVEPLGIPGSKPSDVHTPEVVLYEDDGFKGDEWRTNLNYSYVGSGWNDRISSIIVIAGVWEFYEHRDFGGQVCRLGPGYYGSVEATCGANGVHNDTISSFKCVAWT